MATLRPKLTLKDRRILSDAKAGFLRQIAELKLTGDHLNEIFGMAIRAKLLEPVNQHNRFGEHYFGSHGPNHHVRSANHNPTGTKLVRAFIRRSKKEQTGYRKIYASLTGHQYQQAAE